jgi:hypothetical protein
MSPNSRPAENPCVAPDSDQAAEAAGVSMRIVSKIVNTIDAQTEAG